MKTSSLMFHTAIILTILWSLVPGSGFAQTGQIGQNQEPHLPPSNLATQNYHLYLPSILQPHRGHPAFGVEMDYVSDNPLLALASDAGVRWVRRNGVFWNEIESVEGIRNWSAMADLEAEMGILSRHGMELVLIIRGVPEWARTANGHDCGPIAESKFAAFASFMGDLVRRYSQPPYNVRYWELGNEPDAPYIIDKPFGCWGDPNNSYYGGGQYGKMLMSVYPEVKAADPDAQVLVGGLLMDCDPINPQDDNETCTMSKFLEGILREGAGASFDGVSFHTYDYYDGSLGRYSNRNWHGSSTTTGPILDLKANFLYSVLEQYNQINKYLMVTETALLCDDRYHTCAEEYENTKAIYVAQSYAESLVSQVISSIWYSYTGSWRSTSLLENSTPKPAFYAYQNASQRYYKTIFHQKITIEGLSVYEFTRGADRVWIAWALDRQDHQVDLPTQPTEMWDLYGVPFTPSQNISVGDQPVYIEWSN